MSPIKHRETIIDNNISNDEAQYIAVQVIVSNASNKSKAGRPR